MSNSKLFMIITSADSQVINDAALMYGTNAAKYGWMDEVVLIFWGPSQKTVLENAKLKKRVKGLIGTNKLKVLACKGCSDGYGISEDLEGIGITVKYVGEDVTTMLKQGWYSLNY